MAILPWGIRVSRLSGEHLSKRGERPEGLLWGVTRRWKSPQTYKVVQTLLCTFVWHAWIGKFFLLLSALFFQAEWNFRYLFTHTIYVHIQDTIWVQVREPNARELNTRLNTSWPNWKNKQNKESRKKERPFL